MKDIAPGHTSGVCEQCGEYWERIYQHWSLSHSCEHPDPIPFSKFALFSGGHDSLVSTHYTMENDMAECVLHLDTNTGIPENLEYIRDVCEQYDWPLEVYESPVGLEEFAKEFGFPKAGAHNIAYGWFKLKPLREAARDSVESRQEMYSGIRRDESERRMRIVEDTSKQHTWTWYAPIADWTKEDCEEYIDEHDLPRNEVVSEIHRSGDCYCGAFAHRDTELIDLSAKYPEHAEWLLNTEKRVQEERGTDGDYCWWGAEGVSSERLRELEEDEDSRIPTLCQKCGITYEDGLED